MNIAPGVQDTDWTQLDLDSPKSADWDKAIAILEARLSKRFVEVADFLIKDDDQRQPKDRRFGFVILAIDCLLVETLEAFREGLTDTRKKSQALCTSFLTQRTAFKTFFTATLAGRFYREFRCGISHNAQVFGTGLVWSVGPLLTIDNGRITVNRTEFHKALKQELADYLQELRNPANTRLRKNFRVKMDFVAAGKF